MWCVHSSLKALCPTSGMLLLTACTEGRTFNLFRILPHPSLSSETCVQHLHVLRRGETTSIVSDSNHLLQAEHTCPDVERESQCPPSPGARYCVQLR